MSMKRKSFCLILVLVLLAAALCGCKDSVPAPGSGSSGDGQVSTQATVPAVSTVDDDFYDVGNTDVAGMDQEEYQRFINSANTRKPSDFDDEDPYSTSPVPDGLPKPVEWQNVTIDKNVSYSCTLYIECSLIFNNMDKFNTAKLDVLPADGIIYGARTVTFYKGESAFDVLLREMQNNRIHMEFSMVPGYNSNYIKGINNIYERDCGNLSGWMYCVNGWYPNYGCSRYALKSGDTVEFHYTCDSGRDLGVTWTQW